MEQLNSATASHHGGLRIRSENSPVRPETALLHHNIQVGRLLNSSVGSARRPTIYLGTVNIIVDPHLVHLGDRDVVRACPRVRG